MESKCLKKCSRVCLNMDTAWTPVTVGMWSLFWPPFLYLERSGNKASISWSSCESYTHYRCALAPGKFSFSSVSWVTQSCPTLCDPMNRSPPGFPVHHQLLEFTQTHAHRVCDAIQPSHPLSSPAPPAPNPSQHQGLFQWVSSSHEVAKVLEFQLQHQSFQLTPGLISFRMDWLDLLAVEGTLIKC